MSETFSRYDAADYLKTPEDIGAYLEASAEANDPAQLALEPYPIKWRRPSVILANAGIQSVM